MLAYINTQGCENHNRTYCIIKHAQLSLNNFLLNLLRNHLNKTSLLRSLLRSAMLKIKMMLMNKCELIKNLLHRILNSLSSQKVQLHVLTRLPRKSFTKTKIDFKMDLAMACYSCHCLLSPFIGNGLSRDVQVMVTHLQNSAFLIVHYWRKKYYLKIIIERPMVKATSGMNGLP